MYEIYKECHINSQHATSSYAPDLQMAIGSSSLSGDGDLLVVRPTSFFIKGHFSLHGMPDPQTIICYACIISEQNYLRVHWTDFHQIFAIMVGVVSKLGVDRQPPTYLLLVGI